MNRWTRWQAPRRTSTALCAFALALVLGIGVLAGCGSSQVPSSAGSTPADTQPAKKAFAIAQSTLSTAAPDGKLLVAQVAGPITATTTPVWEFLIGSPKSDVIYAVSVQKDQGKFQEYGKAGLSATEWAAVPSIDNWKIDSNVAHDKAVSVYTEGKSAAYIMGFITYIPKSAKGTTAKAMTWGVSFDPSSKSKSPTSTVEVDMTTGVAAFAK